MIYQIGSFKTILRVKYGNKEGYLTKVTEERLSYKQHLSIKPVANELRQEIGGGSLAGRERILGNCGRIKENAWERLGEIFK